MYHQFNSTSRKAFVSKYGEFGEDASIECLLAALVEVAFFIGLEKKSDIVEMARLHTHKGTSKLLMLQGYPTQTTSMELSSLRPRYLAQLEHCFYLQRTLLHQPSNLIC
ncbi:hypothetical protein F2Q69_00014604 [Brassica cretica]|uniref:Uncharacterized protein n=1 Tax=Brassica cretica TaxID=69181 RepID=A0A8S9QSY9_BRACR|nr:hypothetical protein F2Q69_00014604 [Brassica cretica]